MRSVSLSWTKEKTEWLSCNIIQVIRKTESLPNGEVFSFYNTIFRLNYPPVSFVPDYIYVLFACFLVSLTIFKKLKPEHRYLLLFPPFLFITIVVELIASYMSFEGIPNAYVYSFFTLFEICFYLYMISRMVRQKIAKQVFRWGIPLYAVLSVTNILFIQGTDTFQTVTYALGCLLVVSSCIYYFFELFRLPKSADLRVVPAFWICTALLFFYCCGFPLFGLINFWFEISKVVVDNFETIINILNAFLYSFFMIGFLCIRARNYTLLS